MMRRCRSSLCGRARPRPDDVDRRPVLRGDPRRARSRRRQGRAARTGDDGRAWGPPFWNGESAMFLAVNAGKRSLAVSLRTSAVERSFSDSPTAPTSSSRACAPAAPSGSDSARRRSGRGTRGSSTARSAPTARPGRSREEPGYDALMQAAGGLISMTGEPGRRARASARRSSTWGPGCGPRSAIVAALLERERTGEGTVVDTSLYETALGTSATTSSATSPTGRCRSPKERSSRWWRRTRCFPTRDGELMVAGGNDRLFAALCEVLELPGARRRSALPHEPGPRRGTATSSCDPLGAPPWARLRGLARAPDARGRPGCAGGRRRGRRPLPSRQRRSGCSSRSRIPRSGPPARCAAALVRRGSARGHRPPPAPRRAHGRGPRARPATRTRDRGARGRRRRRSRGASLVRDRLERVELRRAPRREDRGEDPDDDRGDHEDDQLASGTRTR